ncbi:hypothetical protein PIB30_017679 [Stylosanthes scabra]|uniref:Uncharacterized protein n=1 Tax=Stylosanthes scabra TaxID=79078 RepID=A0ABU6Z681_9FABA|nr:hypothetical protein [Stylosanthes scabra]
MPGTTFPSCIEAFKHCKPLISIDETHLHGKYGGHLLLGSQKMGLRQHWRILPADGHLCTACGLKFAQKYKDVDAKKLLMNATYAKSELDFTYWFGLSREVDQSTYEWAKRMELEH